MMPDYRTLIERVQARGGPLWLAPKQHATWRGDTWVVFGPDENNDSVMLDAIEDAEVESADIEDILCGVLRRDMHRRGIRFISVDTQMQLHSQPSEGPNIVAWLQYSDGDAPHGSVDGEEPILALMLRAWLDAADKLGWEPTRGP